MADDARVQAEAYAFRSLVAHLQRRTDVQNIELMILSGFCRNCLSKWLHVGAAHAGLPMAYDDWSSVRHHFDILGGPDDALDELEAHVAFDAVRTRRRLPHEDVRC